MKNLITTGLVTATLLLSALPAQAVVKPPKPGDVIPLTSWQLVKKTKKANLVVCDWKRLVKVGYQKKTEFMTTRGKLDCPNPNGGYRPM